MKSSPSRKRKFIFGSYIYNYDLVLQNRKSLSLTVTPDLQIFLKCPSEASEDRIDTFLRRKWFWLEKQLCFFRKYQRKIYQKEYVSGEGFLYLGKQYKLIVKRANIDKVTLSKGSLMVFTTKSVQNGVYTKKLLDGWYRIKAERLFKIRFCEMRLKFDYKKNQDLTIRDMHKRWGSLTKKNNVILNLKLIQTSVECIDYVIVHELCHVKCKLHNKKYFNYLEKQCSDWKMIKEKLEMYPIQY